MKKLVRDKLAKKFISIDENSIEYLKDEKLIRKYLAKKIIEEANEVSEEILKGRLNKNHLMEEIGDLQEVMYTLSYHFDLNPEDIKEIRDEKYENKGGFEEFTLKVKKVKD